jgi:hypothetical protein
MLINNGESKTQEVFGIGVEVFGVCRNLLAHLLLLKLPNVKLLVAIHEDFNTIRYLHALFWRTTLAQGLKHLLILIEDIPG